MNEKTQVESLNFGRFLFWFVLVIFLISIAGFLFLNPKASLIHRPVVQKGPRLDLHRHLDPGYFTTNSIMRDFEGLTIEHVPGSELKIEYTSALQGALIDNSKFEYHRGSSSQLIQSSDFALKMNWMAVAIPTYEDVVGNGDQGLRLQPKLFNASCEPMETGDEYEPALRDLYLQEPVPSIRFGFEKTAGEDLHFLEGKFLDARTYQDIHTGYGWSHNLDPELHLETELYMWHQAPVLLVLDIASGPVEVHEMPAEEGAEVRIPGGLVKCLGIFEGIANSSNQSNSNGKSVHTFRISENEKSKGLSFVFGMLPKAHGSPIQMEFLDEHGEVLSTGGGSTSGVMKSVRLRDVDLAQIKGIRLKYFPRLHRVLLEIPRIPGLPPENGSLQNLFDVKIPVAQIKNHWGFENWFAKTFQIQFKNTWPVQAKSMTPILFTNTTPNQILVDYLDFCPPGYTWELDSESLQLSLVDASLKGRMTQLAHRFLKVFSR